MSIATRLAGMFGATETTYVDDVFSAYTYTGNGSTQTITNGIDLAGKGGMVWMKRRSSAEENCVNHTARGTHNVLFTDAAVPEYTTAGIGPSSYNSTGFSLAATTWGNTNAQTYVGWTFRNAPKFFHHTTLVKTGGSNATYDFSTLGVLGMVRVKRTDVTGSWYIWHRSLTAGKLLIGETTAAEATLGHITVSGTTVTLVDAVIADGTYLVEGFAHDTSASGLIQCGSYTEGAGDVAVTLGFEPQLLWMRSRNAPGPWLIYDTSREMSKKNGRQLNTQSGDAEASDGAAYWPPTATGFISKTGAFGAGATIIYLAICRPNKPPTVGTQVYNAIARTGTGGAATVTGVGFAPDLVRTWQRTAGGSAGDARHYLTDRLRGATIMLREDGTNADLTVATAITSFDMDGVSDGGHYLVNDNAITYINHFFKRAPGFFDIVADTGTGANKTEAHNLTVAPELWLRKGRSGATTWVFGSSLLANTEKIVCPSPNGKVTDATAWNSTYPTSTLLSLGTLADVNTNAATYVTYLWATLSGISKVGLYTGDGTTGQTINCGFSAGARFVMILRTTASTPQDIFIWDTVRGIVAGNDGHLSLNTTAAEVTTDDTIDATNSGFIVNQVAATNVNVTSAVYLYLAIA